MDANVLVHAPDSLMAPTVPTAALPCSAPHARFGMHSNSAEAMARMILFCVALGIQIRWTMNVGIMLSDCEPACDYHYVHRE